jgi:type VI secretion system protein
MVDTPEPGLQVSFEMTCHLKRTGLVRFGTYFVPPGVFRLERRVREGKI